MNVCNSLGACNYLCIIINICNC